MDAVAAVALFEGLEMVLPVTPAALVLLVLDGVEEFFDFAREEEFEVVDEGELEEELDDFGLFVASDLKTLLRCIRALAR